MRKPKLILKVDRNRRAKLYLNGKWQKDIRVLNISAVPWEYEVEIEQIKRDERGWMCVIDNEVATEKKVYRICQQ